MADFDSSALEFAPIDDDFLECSYHWLMEPEFRQLTLTPAAPDREKQRLWMESLSGREDYHIRGLRLAGAWIGACGVKNIDAAARTAEYWGYIYPELLRGGGLGYRMFQYCRSYAAMRGVELLWLRVWVHNDVAISAYRRWGFHDVAVHDAEVLRMEYRLD